MNNRIVLALGLLAGGCAAHVPVSDIEPPLIETSLFLIGDAGQPDPRSIGAPLDSMHHYARQMPERSIMVFLGDNIYPEGLPEEGSAERADSERRLAAQVHAVPQGARGLFLPGNQDWAGEGPFGLYSIRLQEQMIHRLAGGRNVRMLPSNGCPGPVTLDVGRLRLIALDTQWWLHDYIVRDAASDCTSDIGVVTEELRRAVSSAGPGQVVVVAGHHPLMTGGRHGAYCSLTGPFRRFGGRTQDIISNANRTLRDSLHSAFAARPPLVYAAGHEHNLQVLRGGETVPYLLVSGAGSLAKTECGVRLRETYYVAQYLSGFMRLDVLRDGRVLLRVYEYDGAGIGGLAWSQWLEAA